MTPVSTLPPASAQGRRAVGRAFVGGLAALAVAPAVVRGCWSRRGGEAEAEAEAEVAPLQGPQEAHLLARAHLPAPQAQAGRAVRPTRPGPADAADASRCVRRAGRRRRAGDRAGPARGQPVHLRDDTGPAPARWPGTRASRPGSTPSWRRPRSATRRATPSRAGGRRLAWDAPTMWAHEQAMAGEAWTAMANYQRWCLLRRMRSRRQVLEVGDRVLREPPARAGPRRRRASATAPTTAKLIRCPRARAASTRCWSPRSPTPPWASASTTRTRPRRRPTRTSAASCSSCTPSAAATTPRTTSRTSARILTGYRVDMWATWNAWYDTASHWTGPVQVMGFSHPNADRRRAPGRRGVPDLPRPPPGHRPPPRPQAGGRASSPTRPSDGARRPPGRRSTSPTTPRSSRCSGLWWPTRSSWRPRDSRSAPRPTTSWPPTGRSTSRPRRPPATRSGSQRDAVADRGARPDAVRLGPPGRAAGGRRVVVVGLAGARVVRDPLHAVRRLVADSQDDLPPRGVVGAAAAGQSMRFDALVEHLSRTPPRPDRADAGWSRPCCLATGLSRGDLDHPQPRPREVGHARPADHRARQPRTHEPLT